jgi:hypothetical protein
MSGLLTVEGSSPGGDEGAAAGGAFVASLFAAMDLDVAPDRPASVRGNPDCGRIGSAGPSEALPRRGLAIKPGGMPEGPACFKNLALFPRLFGAVPPTIWG